MGGVWRSLLPFPSVSHFLWFNVKKLTVYTKIHGGKKKITFIN